MGSAFFSGRCPVLGLKGQSATTTKSFLGVAQYPSKPTKTEKPKNRKARKARRTAEPEAPMYWKMVHLSCEISLKNRVALKRFASASVAPDLGDGIQTEGEAGAEGKK